MTIQRYTCNEELLDECPHIDPLLKDDKGGYVLHSDHTAALSTRDARIAELEATIKAHGVEVVLWKCNVDKLRAKLANKGNGEMDRCDIISCNPQRLRCGDSPACGDGSWSWLDGVHRHRCRDLHPQCGHDRVPCEKHQPAELIALLREEVKALRVAVKSKGEEADRLRAKHAKLAAEVRAWRAWKKRVVRYMTCEMPDPTPQIEELKRASAATDEARALEGTP